MKTLTLVALLVLTGCTSNLDLEAATRVRSAVELVVDENHEHMDARGIDPDLQRPKRMRNADLLEAVQQLEESARK